ncbi:PepSY1/2 domain-containing protein [Hydrogenibacillus schlegelii]|uniref:Spore germination protein YpeB n=1 Tax=Hydrogenibacillus schlegelii TaxID=1484 RepID=A0A132N8P4_HYDSH|nr:PepSY1/2 domain-containing protein [Hydrogenibacillus schlegelii]KWX06531.1 hypothetical protein TR75_05680 [Hydrogenibacillus schlegelii]OAR05542.1 hypothetical protein SA87_11725 [Hydrogenibacillus schlegelii]PTQ54007.1 MAG: Spore germination protein YpeB [Hydrogenibacillus schlegelii]
MRRSTWWTAAALVASLIVSLYWGYRESREKTALLIRAENAYQHHFADLVSTVDDLHDALGRAVATNGAGPQSATLAAVWRLANAAQNAAGGLPLSLVPLGETERFLSRIGEFAYQLLRRDVHAHPLTPEERRTLLELYRASGRVRAELEKLQEAVYTRKLRWMDVEQALAQAELKEDHGLIDGLRSLGSESETFLNMDLGPLPASGAERREAALRRLGQEIKPIPPAEAVERARSLLGLPDGIRGEAVAVHDAAPLYDVTFSPDKDVTVTAELLGDGRLLWWMKSRPFGPARYSPEQGRVRAERALRATGHPAMVLVRSEVEDGIGTYTFVPTAGAVRLYPEAVVVVVALDDGEVVGLNRSDYVLFHREKRPPLRPILSREAAQKKLAPDFRVEASELALIVGETGKEVLTYAFTGSLGGSRYRIFVNADTGLEESVEILSGSGEGEER